VRLRVILFETPYDAYFNLALEEAIYYVAGKKGCREPILRIWRNANAAVIGYFQRAEEEVDLEYAQEIGAAIVRRFTGGGAVYHDLGNVNYAVIVSRRTPNPLTEIYGSLLKGTLYALKKLGASPKIENVNDIIVNSRKVSGTAATFKNNILFLHGCLLVSSDLNILRSLLKTPKKKLENNKASSVKYRVTLLEDALGRRLDFSEIVDVLVRGYEELLQLKAYYDLPSKLELQVAKILYEGKYRRNEWNLERFPSSKFAEVYRRIDELITES